MRRIVKRLIDAAPDAIVLVNRSGTIVGANRQATRLFGFRRAELVGADLDILIPRRAREAHREHVARYFEAPKTRLMNSGLELYARRKDGSEFPAEIMLSPLETEEGTVTVSAIRDISGRLEVEEALRRSEAKYRKLIELAPDAILLADPASGELLDCNAAACTLFGRSRDDLIGSHQRTLHPDSMQEEAEASFRRFVDAISRGERVRQEAIPILRANGTTGYADIVGRCVKIGEGRIAYAFFRDVTERIRREQQLRQSERRLKEAQRIAQLGHWIWNIETGALHWSDEVYRIFGLEPREVEPTYEAFLDKVHPEDRPEVEQAVGDALRSGTPYYAEHRIVRPDGEVRVVEERGEVTETEDGAPRRMAGTVLDITERKELEAQLRHSQKMKTVGTLAGGIAHDFNNILHTVLIYVQTTIDDLQDENTRHVVSREHLRRAVKGIERAKKLTEKLLTFSRQDGPETREVICLNEAVEETVELIRPTLPSNVELRCRLSAACRVRGDADQMQQVTMNLLTNAGQAIGEEEGRLEIGLQEVSVDEVLARRHLRLEPGRYALLSVSDTGSGMDEATKSRIFEPFFTTKKMEGGTGLGLSVVHGIVQSHGGAVSVYTEPGEGTTFHIYLPSADHAVTDGAPRSELAPDAALRGSHILLVEDDEEVAEVEAARLDRLGCEVTFCACGREALSVLKARPANFDLVLTDYAMPGGSGLELARDIKCVRPELPIVLMSGFGAQVSRQDFEKSGIDRYVKKPILTGDLKRTLAELLAAE